MTARDIFEQQDGQVTLAYYAEMKTKGLLGELAVALFRAQKRSTAAKSYRGGRFRREAYGVKNWSLSEVCRILMLMPDRFRWGWKRDENTPGFENVLYVDLPQGQCSFHSGDRLQGPEYPGDWDGLKLSKERILAFCDSVAGNPVETIIPQAKPEPPPPTNPWDRMRQQLIR